MPDVVNSTKVLEVFIVNNKEELSNNFLEYDTKTTNGLNYKLPSGKLIVVLLISKTVLWTTIRSWTKEKEKYYRDMRGKFIPVRIESGNYIR